MKLLRLSLRNFQAFRDFAFEPNGQSVVVLGRNGAGKTTLKSAADWLLWGKDSEGRTDFDLKTLVNGEPESGVDHEVEGVYELADGRRMTLTRTYREKWVKRRGEATRTMTGHETLFAIDGVPMSKGEYEGKVAELASEDRFRLLSDPRHFPERLHWNERRKVLTTICGDEDAIQSEVLASSPDLEKLRPILASRSPLDHRKKLAADRASLNQQIGEMPVRIDEAERGLPEITAGETAEKAATELNQLRALRHDAESERSRIAAGGQSAELRRQLATLDGQLEAIKARLESQRSGHIENLTRAKRTADAAKSDAEQSLQRAIREKESSERELEALESDRDRLRGEFTAENAKAFVPAIGDDVCAACGQSLPPASVAEARSAAEAAFNAAKASRLREIDERGMRLKGQSAALSQELEKQAASVERSRAELATAEEQALAAAESLELARSTPLEIEADPDYATQLAERASLQAKVDALEAGELGPLEEARQAVADLDAEIERAEARVARHAMLAAGRSRIDDLRAEERELAGKIERIEFELSLLDKLDRKVAERLDALVSEHFKVARFKLFKPLINGGQEPCCEVVGGNGEGYSSGLNDGQKIQVGLDIVRTLQRHYGFRCQVWVDHAESVTEALPDMGCQVIRLVARPNVNELAIEVES